MRSGSGIRVLAATADGLHVLGGRTAPRLVGHEVRNILVAKDGWWCIVDRRHVYQRRRGSRWKRIATLEDGDGLCLLVAKGVVWVGSSGARLYRLDDGRLREVQAFTDHPSRRRWYTPWGGPPDTRSLAASRNGTVYANVHVGGILRSDDGGASWRDTLDIDADAHQVVADPDRPQRVYAATARGVAVSGDGGASWRFETRGFHATYQRAVAVCRDRLLVSASRSERGREAAVFARPRARTAEWVRLADGLPHWFDTNINTFCLAGLGESAAIGTAGGDVYVSADQGARWERLGEGLPPVRAIAIARG